MNYLFTTTFACVFCILTTNYASAQYLPAITSVYGDSWVANNPDAVTALEDCFVNRMKYLVEPLTPNDKYPLLSSFPLMNRYNPTIVAINYSQFNPATFIPITYNLPFFSDQKQVIRVDGTNYIIVIDPVTLR
ncbi:MAG: hypothetical protein K0S23_3266 [Fluviicola sp.]|jgi:hypothetical protein|uniref:hypothetical protein n=1 Tax=Fluviicola sp. TaxID=1917219 RepID=UPI0026352F5D|nr:hypothetical protein [Fluviicola sp.]MDF3028959.1 hypothetical protein [Fluviicola sp.]